MIAAARDSTPRLPGTGASPEGLLSEKPPLRERQACAGRHDEMVQHLHVHERGRFGERACQRLILDAGLRNTGGMVVREDERRGVVVQGTLEDLTRINASGTI